MRAVNLIPAEQRGGNPVGAGRSGGVAYAVLGLLVGVALLALLYGMAKHQVSSRTSEVASLQARAQQAQANAQQLAPYTSFIALRQARQQAVEALVDSRFDWAHAFHEFGRVLPKDASLSSISGTIGAATPSGSSSSSSSSSSASKSSSASSSSVASATPPGSVPTFAVSGCATTQDAVAETIDRLRLIDGVTNVSLTSSARPGVSSSSAGATSGSGCAGNAPTFTLQVSFQPLPTAAVAAAAASTRTVAATSGSAAKGATASTTAPAPAATGQGAPQ
jgi:hypothetical protein